MQTNKAIQYATRGGLPFTIPAGASVEPVPSDADMFYVLPSTFARNSIERHDATYYGVRVSAADVQEVDDAQ